MNLEQFIQALENCPDENLTKELGVQDNWIVYLNGNSETIVRDLLQSGLYTTIEGEFLSHEQKHTSIRVLDRVFKPLGVKVDEQRLKDYNMAFIFCNTSDSEKRLKLKDVNPIRDTAKTICDIGRYIQEHQLPAYFPMAKPPIYHPN